MYVITANASDMFNFYGREDNYSPLYIHTLQPWYNCPSLMFKPNAEQVHG